MNCMDDKSLEKLAMEKIPSTSWNCVDEFL